MVQENLRLTRADRRIASSHWGLVRARYHFAAEFVLDKDVIEIAPEHSIGTDVLHAAGARSVRRVDIAETKSLPGEVADVAICVTPGRRFDRDDAALLSHIIRSEGVAIACVPTEGVGGLEREFGDIRLLAQTALGYRFTVPLEPDPDIAAPGTLGWLLFLVRDAAARLVRDRGIHPGEYDFTFSDSGEGPTHLWVGSK